MKFKNNVKITDILNSEIKSGFANNREDLKQKAKKNILKVQNEICKDYYLRKKSPTNLKFMILLPLNADKKFLELKRKYLGTYKVIKVKNNDTYDVQKSDLPKI